MPPNPLVTIYRGVKENAGKAYLRGEKGIVKPRGNWLTGYSNPYLHNAGQTSNSRFTSWTYDKDVATSFALRSGGEKGIVMRITVPMSKLTISPNIKETLLKYKGFRINESETHLSS